MLDLIIDSDMELGLAPKNMACFDKEVVGDEMKDSEKVAYMEDELRELKKKLRKTQSILAETNQKIATTETEIEKLHFLKETLTNKCGIWEEVIERLCFALAETEMKIEDSATKLEDFK